MRSFIDLRTDQQSCVTDLYERDRSYVVMRCGGGKTATCLTALAELFRDGHRRRAIVIAPPLVAATVWPAEPAKWEHLKHLKVVALTGGPVARKKLLETSDADIFTISDGCIGWLVDFLHSVPDDSPLLDVIAYDEPKLKDPRGHIGKQLCEIAARVKTMWLFSGTPRPNGYADLFMPARVLVPELWGDDFDLWRRRNFMPMDFQGFAWEVHDFRAKELDVGLREFMVQAAEPRDTRRGTLTSGVEQDFEVDLPDEARKLYAKMERDLLIEVQKNLAMDRQHAFEHDADDPTLIVALSQAVASSKLAQLAQGFVYETPEDGGAPIPHAVHTAKRDALTYLLDAAASENVVICYGFRDDLAVIEDVLKKRKARYGLLGGGRSIKQKMADVALWNEGKLNNLILHPASAGHGIELQFGGRRMIWYDPTWSAEQYDQTIKRLDRPGQTKQVYSHQIIARDTVDIIKRNRVEFKMNDQDAFKTLLRTL